MRVHKIDRTYLISILAITLAGFFIFSSASLGLLARDGAKFSTVALTQGVSLIMGLLSFWIFSKINYKIWKKSAFYILIGAFILNLLLYVPGIAMTHGGATRWIDLKFTTFQPSEFLKIAVIIYLSAWFSSKRDKAESFKEGFLPFVIIMTLVAGFLYIQNDTDTFVVISATAFAIYSVAGAKLKHLLIIVLMGAIALATIITVKPYAKQRIMTYLNPASDPQGSGYQIQQSLIAIGSGQATGRGFGQSVQKFNYLPEPIGDSIFAVAAEEFGFIGSTILVFLYIFFSVMAFRIASRAPDPFGGLMVVGIVILIVIESFMNIGSMLGVLPLSGMPLLFVSHGGTALVMALASAGIIANISKYKK